MVSQIPKKVQASKKRLPGKHKRLYVCALHVTVITYHLLSLFLPVGHVMSGPALMLGRPPS